MYFQCHRYHFGGERESARGVHNRLIARRIANRAQNRCGVRVGAQSRGARMKYDVIIAGAGFAGLAAAGELCDKGVLLIDQDFCTSPELYATNERESCI
jgi:NADPH-dependent 2,4-dienoyl-CoA reductase/sulfur reductase-like enzyme